MSNLSSFIASSIENIFWPVNYQALFESFLLMLIGIATAKMISIIFIKITHEDSSEHYRIISEKILFYLTISIFFIASINRLGVTLSTILGAAGLFTVAIGFAAQNSISNLISGLFLLGEQTFKIHDHIIIDDQVGEIININILSIKVRLRDNTLMRIPNETFLKTNVQNMSYFKIHRIDTSITFPFNVNIDKIQDLLCKKLEFICLSSPKLEIIITEFNDFGIKAKIICWVKTEEYFHLKAIITKTIYDTLKENKITPNAPKHLIIEKV